MATPKPRQRVSPLDEKPEINSTVSTKLSTDQLICKSPPSSVSTSVEDAETSKDTTVERTPITLYLGVLQILFGMLMAVFGVLVLVHDSNLSQIGGGLWGGCLAALTGVMGIFSVAKECCPLKSNFQRVAHTAFLALSLVSLAVAQLVLVIACIGLARDSTNNDFAGDEPSQNEEEVTPNYTTILTNTGLLIVSACECISAALSAYHSSRVLCPCFRPTPGDPARDRHMDHDQYGHMSPANKNMLVSSWLGKQPGAVYAVVQGKVGNKGMPMMAPVFTVSPPSSVMPSLVGYPLIPAPLGTTPPPVLNTLTRPHVHRERLHRKRRRPAERTIQRSPKASPPQDKTKKKKKKEKKPTITTADVAKTYTGLDRVIAEEFIEICETRNSSSDCSGCTSSDSTSNEGSK